ncbi:MAG: hypothetical protein R3D78_05930 [Paracoccaceae bacterium]
MDHLDRVARIDRALERVSRDSLDLPRSASRPSNAATRQHVLSARGRGREDGVVFARERRDQRGDGLGQTLLQRLGLGKITERTCKARRRFGGTRYAAPANQDIDRAADLRRGAQGLSRSLSDRVALSCSAKKNAWSWSPSGQMTPASFSVCRAVRRRCRKADARRAPGGFLDQAR